MAIILHVTQYIQYHLPQISSWIPLTSTIHQGCLSRPPDAVVPGSEMEGVGCCSPGTSEPSTSVVNEGKFSKPNLTRTGRSFWLARLVGNEGMNPFTLVYWGWMKLPENSLLFGPARSSLSEIYGEFIQVPLEVRFFFVEKKQTPSGPC